jgi:hypothetical protein
MTSRGQVNFLPWSMESPFYRGADILPGPILALGSAHCTKIRR